MYTHTRAVPTAAQAGAPPAGRPPPWRTRSCTGPAGLTHRPRTGPDTPDAAGPQSPLRQPKGRGGASPAEMTPPAPAGAERGEGRGRRSEPTWRPRGGGSRGTAALTFSAQVTPAMPPPTTTNRLRARPEATAISLPDPDPPPGPGWGAERSGGSGAPPMAPGRGQTSSAGGAYPPRRARAGPGRGGAESPLAHPPQNRFSP